MIASSLLLLLLCACRHSAAWPQAGGADGRQTRRSRARVPIRAADLPPGAQRPDAQWCFADVAHAVLPGGLSAAPLRDGRHALWFAGDARPTRADRPPAVVGRAGIEVRTCLSLANLSFVVPFS